MRVLQAHGDTPLAQAARIHEAMGCVRDCCEEHARADVALAVERARQIVAPLVEREKEVERVGPDIMGLVLR